MNDAPVGSSIQSANGSIMQTWIMWFARLVKIVNASDLSNLPTYANNAAALAGGMTVGKFYRTATGQVMQVY